MGDGVYPTARGGGGKCVCMGFGVSVALCGKRRGVPVGW
jgi:hypothetical protein